MQDRGLKMQPSLFRIFTELIGWKNKERTEITIMLNDNNTTSVDREQINAR